jgi:hypothetical protein
VADYFGDGVSDVSYGYFEVCVNSGSDFIHKGACAILGLLWFWPRGCIFSRLSLRGLIPSILRHNFRPILQIINIVGKQIVLLRVNE